MGYTNAPGKPGTWAAFVVIWLGIGLYVAKEKVGGEAFSLLVLACGFFGGRCFALAMCAYERKRGKTLLGRPLTAPAGVPLGGSETRGRNSE